MIAASIVVSAIIIGYSIEIGAKKIARAIEYLRR